MWTSRSEVTDHGRARKVTILRDAAPLSYAEVVRGWRDDPAFRGFYLSLLAAAPFDAMFWESPAVTRSSVDESYECVLVDSPQLAQARPDRQSFAASFKSAAAGTDVLAFENLSGDALLVVPCPSGPDHAYTHLSAFARSAPDTQRHALLRKLAEQLDSQLSDRPLWISTSGLGVFWLHIRLDSRPKYYVYRPYKNYSAPPQA